MITISERRSMQGRGSLCGRCRNSKITLCFNSRFIICDLPPRFSTRGRFTMSDSPSAIHSQSYLKYSNERKSITGISFNDISLSPEVEFLKDMAKLRPREFTSSSRSSLYKLGASFHKIKIMKIAPNRHNKPLIEYYLN